MLATHEWLALFISAIAVLCVKKLTGVRPAAIFNIYQRPGNFYWTKVLFMCIYIALKKFNTRRPNWKNLDQAQNLSCKTKPIDGVHFTGSNANHDCLIMSMTRRDQGLIDTYIFLKLANSGILVLPKFPKTSSLTDSTGEDGFRADGVTITPMESMRKWRLVYSGKLKDNNNQWHEVLVNVLWSSNLPCFNFSTDMNTLSVAKAIATETWNEDFFKMMNLIRQKYYEQPGHMEGTVVIDGEEHEINFGATRYHTFGYQRDWRNFHRYIVHFITVENGDQISVGVISMPITISSLYVGYVYSAKNKTIQALQECDLKLYQHGENGKPPLDYAFSIRAGGKDYAVEVIVSDSRKFYLSENYEARVLERFCKFSVNGNQGWGTAEWQYRNV